MRGSDKVRIASKRIPLVEFFKKNPRCFLARFFLDFQSYLLLTLTVVFGGKIGLSPEKSGLLITACMISGFSDVWVGFLLKKGDSYKMIRYGFLGCVICFSGVIFFYHSYFFLLIAYFLFGVSVAFIYVSAFKLTNDDYKKSHLISANSTFQLIGSLGGLFGSLIGGFFIDIFQQIGLPIAIIASASLYLILTIFHRAQIKK
jgi:MFS family permease